MAISVLKERGSSESSIARTLGVTEGAVRYHLRPDGGVGGKIGLRTQRHRRCKGVFRDPGLRTKRVPRFQLGRRERSTRARRYRGRSA